MSTFETMNIAPEIMKGLKKQNIITPTKVQKEVFEPILQDQDLVVQSKTGSGKTLAYLLPLIEKYKEEQKKNKVIVLVPTQELAMQVHRQVELLAKNAEVEITSTAVFGKVNIDRQIKALRVKPLIIVGTAARILELIQKKKINAQSVHTIVLDEADKLVDKKMIQSTKDVIRCTMKDRQLLFFSASMPANVIDQAKALAKEPVIIKSKEKELIPAEITHQYIVIKRNERIETLRKLVHAIKSQKTMIFINGQHDIEEATMKLQYHHYSIAAIYKNVDKMNRKKAIDGFRSGKIKNLIATDIAARGLDFANVEAVIHLTLPEEARDYLHRAGRSGRNGAKGTSIAIVTEHEVAKIKRFERQLKVPFTEVIVREGKLVKRGDKKE